MSPLPFSRERDKGTIIKIRGKVQGSTIIDNPARNASEYPGINSDEVIKLKILIRIIDKSTNAENTNQIFKIFKFIYQ